MPRTPEGATRARVLAFVRERLLGGQPPTVREVQHALGFRSVATARQHLEALIATGKLERPTDGRHRGVRLPGGVHAPSRLVPLLGRVQAGALTEAIEDAEDHVVVAERGSASGPAAELFALRVRGDSMAPEIIADDVIVVRRQPAADNGDVVVALVDGEATVKRLRFVRGRAELHATNPHFPTIVPATLTLLGKVVELRRWFDRSSPAPR
ncbi:MAG: transcriptional repressor LexA [Planctomycetota bacterium]